MLNIVREGISITGKFQFIENFNIQKERDYMRDDCERFLPLYSDKQEMDSDSTGESYYHKADRLRKGRIYQGGEYANPDRIKLLEEEIKLRIKITQREIFTIGELLYEAKQILSGEFQKWIEEKLNFSYDTAHNFMNVYQCCFGHKEIATAIKPSILYKLSTPSFPDELREYIFSQVDLEKLTNKNIAEMKEVYKEEGFEAIKEKFEGVTRTHRIHDLTRYQIEILELGIQNLEKQRDKIENFQKGIHPDYGHESVGIELNKRICNGINKAIEDLDSIKQSVLNNLCPAPGHKPGTIITCNVDVITEPKITRTLEVLVESEDNKFIELKMMTEPEVKKFHDLKRKPK